MSDINASMTINDVVNKHPKTMKIFSKYKLDTCCGGHQEIDVAAQLYGADLDTLMKELEETITNER